tara:strand:+ start:1382 stop:1747 length:366 start_codon:yes stop_codon:yes gene_type:complete
MEILLSVKEETKIGLFKRVLKILSALVEDAHQLTEQEVIVLATIMANDDGRSFFSGINKLKLMEMFQVKEATVHYYKRRLCGKKWIKKDTSLSDQLIYLKNEINFNLKSNENIKLTINVEV